MKLKEEYTRENQKLLEITYGPDFCHHKRKFQAHKSMSCKPKRGCTIKVNAPNSSQFKEDNLLGFQESPLEVKKSLSSFKAPVEFATPAYSKRSLPRTSQPIINLRPAAVEYTSLKSPTMQGILQINSNHVVQKSLFSNKRATGNVGALREKLKHALGTDLNQEMNTLHPNWKQGSPQQQDKDKSPKPRLVPLQLSGLITNSKATSPVVMTPVMRNRVLNPQITPSLQNIEDDKSTPKKAAQRAHKRTTSMELFRAIHKEEDTRGKAFPSLIKRCYISF